MQLMERMILRCSLRVRELSARLRKEAGKVLGSFDCPPVCFAMLSGNVLGQYCPQQNVICLSEALLDQSWDIVFHVMLHECAHFLNYRLNGSLAHDASFRKLCIKTGAGEDWGHSRVNLAKQQRIIDKVRKLKALSSSPFAAESEAALKKVRQLVASYSLEAEDDEESVYMCDLASSRSRISFKAAVLAGIVSDQTGIFVLKTHDQGSAVLRAFGTRDELEVAGYLYDVLENALERELKKERKSRPELRGASGTNNFYAGVRQALRERLEKERNDEQSPAKALMIISRDNEDRTRRIVYPDARITRRKARHIYNETAWKEGLSCGKRLQLRAAVKKENTLSLSLPSGKL